MRRVSLEPAFVLHRRAYGETSFLIEVFTENHGRFTVLARGVRKSRSASSGLLQAFTPLLISWAGKGELVTLTHSELQSSVNALQGDSLFAGFYLNELIMALLQKWDAYPELFHRYATTLNALQLAPLQQSLLRHFEKFLLEQLGYGLLPGASEDAAHFFQADAFYRFVPEQGLMISQAPAQANHLFLGKHLIAMAQEAWCPESLQTAKRLMRTVLAPLLGAKKIHSRRLFLTLEDEAHDTA